MSFLYGPMAIGDTIRGVGTVPRCLIAESVEELDEIVKGGFPEDQYRIHNYSIAVDIYEKNYQPYLAGWINGNRNKELNARYSPIMARVVEVLSEHLYKRAPIREIVGFPEATSILNQIYDASDFNAVMQEADQLTYVTDASALEFVPNDGDDAVDVPVKIRVWNASEFVPVFLPDDQNIPWAVCTLSSYGKRRACRVFTNEFARLYLSTSNSVAQQTVAFTGKGAEQKTGTGYEQVGETTNHLGAVPFEFVHFKKPTNKFWTSGVGLLLAHVNIHMNYRMSNLSYQTDQWRPKGVLTGVPEDFNFPPDQEPGQYTRLPPSADGMRTSSDAIAQYIGPDLTFTQFDWQDIQNYWEHAVEMIGVPPSAIRMEQQGGTSGVAIMSEQLPLIERAEKRQPLMLSFERAIAKKCLTAALGHYLTALTSGTLDPETAMLVEQRAAIIEQALPAMSTAFRVTWPTMTKNRPGPDRDAHDGFQLNMVTKSRTEMLAEDKGIPLEEAFVQIQRTMSLVQMENMLLAQAQMPLMPPPAEGEGKEKPADGGEKDDSGDESNAEG